MTPRFENSHGKIYQFIAFFGFLWYDVWRKSFLVIALPKAGNSRREIYQTGELHYGENCALHFVC